MRGVAVGGKLLLSFTLFSNHYKLKIRNLMSNIQNMSLEEHIMGAFWAATQVHYSGACASWYSWRFETSSNVVFFIPWIRIGAFAAETIVNLPSVGIIIDIFLHGDLFMMLWCVCHQDWKNREILVEIHGQQRFYGWWSTSYALYRRHVVRDCWLPSLRPVKTLFLRLGTLMIQKEPTVLPAAFPNTLG